MKNILVTGFRPFLGETVNPSEILAEELSRTCAVKCLILPVEFTKAYQHLNSHLQNLNYDYVLMLGQAAGRESICLEKIAINWIQTESADEAGYLPPIGRIAPDQPLALMSSFPVDKVYLRLKSDGEPVKISFSAGTYVCNELYFMMLSRYPALKSVFIHVPLMQEQVGAEKPRPFLDQIRQLEIMKKIINELQSER